MNNGTLKQKRINIDDEPNVMKRSKSLDPSVNSRATLLNSDTFEFSEKENQNINIQNNEMYKYDSDIKSIVNPNAKTFEIPSEVRFMLAASEKSEDDFKKYCDSRNMNYARHMAREVMVERRVEAHIAKIKQLENEREDITNQSVHSKTCFLVDFIKNNPTAVANRTLSVEFPKKPYSDFLWRRNVLAPLQESFYKGETVESQIMKNGNKLSQWIGRKSFNSRGDDMKYLISVIEKDDDLLSLILSCSNSDDINDPIHSRICDYVT